MFTGHVSNFMRQKAKGSRPKRNAERRVGRRQVMPGFPIEPRPFSRQEIKDYLSGDHITCLICGKAYKALGVHVPIHGITIDDYRVLYGLPWRSGIQCAATQEKRAEATRSHLGPGAAATAAHARTFLGDSASHQRSQPFRKEVRRANMLKAHNREQVHPVGTFHLILETMIREDQTLREVCEDPDLPSDSWFRREIRKDPKKQSSYRRATEQLSFATLARAELIGDSPKFLAHI